MRHGAQRSLKNAGMKADVAGLKARSTRTYPRKKPLRAQQ
jgi:hypothetical protein